MKRSEREQLIERYLSGTMTSSEEQDFFIEVAANKELRIELKAYQIVESAVRKDVAADTTSYAALRAHMIGALGTPPVPAAGSANGGGAVGSAPSAAPATSAASATSVPVASATSVPAASAPAAATGTGILPQAAALITGSMKWLAAVGAGAMLATGAILLPPWGRDAAPQGATARPVPQRNADTTTVVASPQVSLPEPSPAPVIEAPEEDAADVSAPQSTPKQVGADARRPQREKPVKNSVQRMKQDEISTTSGKNNDDYIEPNMASKSKQREKIFRDTSALDQPGKITITPPRNTMVPREDK